MTNPYPAPLDLPAMLPVRLDRLTLTLQYTPEAIDRGWAQERLWLISEDLRDMEQCLTSGFFRNATTPPSLHMDQHNGTGAELVIEAAGMAAAWVTLLARYLVTMHSPTGLSDMRPETALTTARFDIPGPGGGQTVALADRLHWPTDAGPMPQITPDDDLVLIREGQITLPGSLAESFDFLEALGVFATSGALIPLGQHSGDVDPFEYAAWTRANANGSSDLLIEDLAIERTALAALVRALSPEISGSLLIKDME
ncbi:hypothetical protein [Jannaschia sp. CCS1]|uniref:hypothetical protein n=1 Tax=Jannaschia sp. (strain CCS1) TaxID=290400 RepID=UPI000053C5AB|nr:hypothetical protein [Jannaschia sp. CCS1]ABD55930.1 hypothetical protein Jann_3013 [Jannaschia sp. CCS1]